MVLLLASLLIWASLSIDGASGYSNIDGAKCPLQTSGGSIGGWNGIGQGFLNMFTPAKLTNDHWKIIGKMKKKFEASLINEFAFSMGGVVFLVVVSIILILLFCAAPIAYGVFTCTCKKKCKPKSNAIVAYTGLGCTSLAILTISLSILFCYLSIASIDIVRVGTAIKPLPEVAVCIVKTLMEEVSAEARKLTGSLTDSVEKIPAQLADKVWNITTLQAVMKIDIAGKGKQIDGFVTETGVLSGKLDEMITDMESYRTQNPLVASYLDTPLQDLTKTKTQLDKITTELKGPMKQKLQDVSDERDKTTKSTIETKINEKTGDTRNKISKVAKDVDKKINGGFNSESLSKEISKITEKIGSYVDKAKDYTGYLNAVMLVLLPCILALVSAIWSCCQATKFVQKKKAKPKEKGALLIPLAIGLALAFLPLLTSTAFMSSAAVSNVVCSTVFKDQSFGFLPNALHAFDVNSTLSIKGITVNIPSVLQECKNGKPMIAAINGGSLLDENMVSKQFDIKAKQTDLKNAIQNIQFPLPSAASWGVIERKIDEIEGYRTTSNTQIASLRDFKIISPPLTLVTVIPKVNEHLNDLEAFLVKVAPFEKECRDDIATVKALDVAVLRNEMKKILLGEGTTPGQLHKMFSTVDAAYKNFRTELLTQSTNCLFFFEIFKNIGEVVCNQGLGGLNGIYAAIGLAVFSFFSATFGTVMIWHSLRAGKEKKEEKSSDDSNKKKKKKGEGEGGGEGGEVEEESPNMAGKIGEQAEPMKKPISSEPTPPAGQPVAPPLVQAVPTDPAAPGEKTNPSLLPNDGQLAGDPAAAAGLQPESGGPTAGTPLSPNPIQMVNMETNNNNPASQKSEVGQQKSDKQNSITGAGGGETAGAGATNPQ